SLTESSPSELAKLPKRANGIPICYARAPSRNYAGICLETNRTKSSKRPDLLETCAWAVRRWRPDCVAGHIGLELKNVGANYPFEKRRRFRAIEPNSGHRDCSPLSCGGGETQLGPSTVAAGVFLRGCWLMADTRRSWRDFARIQR